MDTGVMDSVGSVLSRETIAELMAGDSALISGHLSRDEQLQPCGVDLTLAAVYDIAGSGRLGVDERHLPDRLPVAFDFWGWLHLAAGSYVVLFNETVRLPLDVMGLGRPRSSLARCGAALHTAVWDPGYVGRSEALLIVENAAGIDLQKDARIMQLVFFRLETPTSQGYNGRFQGEHLAG
ncbi:MAG: deoxyuridine 5'-triphosphate nucleotidohydrolase [Chloroflexota bacterium]